MLKLAYLIVGIFLVATIGVAAAGTVYTMSERIGPKPDKMQLSVDGQSLRMDQSSNDTVIFNGAKGNALTIDHGKKSYIVLDREAVARTVEQLNPALEQMRKQLESLPPDQRAMVEKMMGGKMPATQSAPPSWEIVASGETGKQAGIDCEWYEMSRDGKLSQRLCMADPDDVVGGREALTNMRAMAKFFNEVFTEIRQQLPIAMPDNPMSNIDKVDGFPIITQELRNGSVSSDLRLESAEAKSIDGNAFEPPEGYSQQRLGGR